MVRTFWCFLAWVMAWMLAGCVSSGYVPPQLDFSQAAVVAGGIQGFVQKVDGLTAARPGRFGTLYVGTQDVVLSPGKHVVECEGESYISADPIGGNMSAVRQYRYEYVFEMGHTYVVQGTGSPLLDRTTAKVIVPTSPDGMPTNFCAPEFTAQANPTIGLEVQDMRADKQSQFDPQVIVKVFAERLNNAGYAVQTPPGDATVVLRVSVNIFEDLNLLIGTQRSVAGSAELVDAKTGHVYWRDSGLRVYHTATGMMVAAIAGVGASEKVRVAFATDLLKTFPVHR